MTIAMLPEGDWKASKSETIAARLVNWLPGRSAEGHSFGISRTQRRRKGRDEVGVCDVVGVVRACRRPGSF